MSETGESQALRAADFFMLRTPSLPVSDLDAIRAACATPGELRNHEVVNRPQVKEAIYLASQNLYEALYERDAPMDRRTELAVARYLLRMATRSTPFGAFAGVAVGDIGAGTDLQIGPAERGARVCRVDLGVLSTVQAGLSSAAASSLPGMPLVLNDAAWSAPDGVRYVEAIRGAAHTQYRLSRVRNNAGVELVAEALKEAPRTAADLAELLVGRLGVERKEAEAFVAGLLEAQVIVPACQLPVTGSEVVRSFIGELERIGELPDEVKSIASANEELASVGLDPVANVATYRRVLERLQPAGEIEEGAKAIQVDLHWAEASPRLDAAFVDKIISQIRALAPVLAHPPQPLTTFVTEFEARYGSDWIPLLEALDQDLGIEFGGSSRVPAPLLKGLAPGRRRNTPGEVRDLDLILQTWVFRALVRRESEIEITDDDLSVIPQRAAMPSTMALIGSLSADSDRAPSGADPMFDVHGFFGPPAASLMGRFAAASPGLASKLKALIEETEGDTDDAVIAELAHLPDGRVGNVTLRPILRNIEIEYKGRSGLDREHVIPASELLVGVQHGRVFLYSPTLGKRVLPRISNAHNLAHPLNLPIYRFFGALQRQDESTVGWTWGAQLSQAIYLPGVRYKGLRLARERWAMGKVMAQTFLAPEEASEELRRKLAGYPPPPRRFRLRQGDNFIELDLDKAVDREIFAEECRRGNLLTLEALGGREDLAVDDRGRRYNQEIVIPLASAHAARRSPPPVVVRPREGRFAPGSKYLYARVFCGPATSDRLVAEEFETFRRFAVTNGGARPFFIRYYENGYHLRIRVAGAPKDVWGPIREKLEELLEPHIVSRAVSRVEYATYFPEYARYGDLEACETIFSADSIATSAALRLLVRGGNLEERRWRFAALSLLDLVACGFESEAEALAQLEAIADGYAKEFAIGKRQNNEIKAAYRRHRDLFDAVAQGTPSPELDPYRGLLAERRQETAAAFDALRRAEKPGMRIVMPSLFHMCANRIFPEQGRPHELMLSHLLAKALKGAAARKRYDRREATVQA